MAQPKSRQRVYAYVKPDRFVLESMEAVAVWTGSEDVSGIATTATHREGSVAITFDKDGTTEDFGMISKTLDSERQLNLVDYLRGKLRMWISLSALTDIASVDLIIGESASHCYVYTKADTDLTTGFNEVSFDVDAPTSTVGNGAAWSSIGYIAVRVNFDGDSDTLTAIIVDAITIQNETEVKVENLSIAGTGLATSAKQDTQTTELQKMGGWDNAASDGASVSGDVAHDSADAGEPVKMGFRAVDPTSPPSDVAANDRANGISDLKGRQIVTLGTLLAGEDQTNNVMRVEGQFTYLQCTADTQVKGTPGFIHTLTIQSTDAVPTAGTIIVYDNTAESGTEICRFDIKATANIGIQSSQTIILDVLALTGIYVGFTTTADVRLTVAYR